MRKKTDENDPELISKLRAELDATVEAIAPEHALRLRRIRLQALQSRKGNRWYRLFPYWMTPARVSFAAVLLVAVSLFTLNPSQHRTAPSPEDLEVVASQEQVAMIQDLDFYRWLAASRPAAPAPSATRR